MLDPRYKELLALDVSLRNEADAMLKQTGLGGIITKAGYHPVGSYVMQTMVWRDLDFEREIDDPTWEEHWRLGKELADNGHVWKFSGVDAYRDLRNPGEKGFYWGVQFDYPHGGPIWKIDLWSARRGEFESLDKRALWMSRLTEESRSNILEIKNAIWEHPDYRKTLLSVHVYEAVLENGIQGIESFWAWWNRRYGPSIKQANIEVSDNGFSKIALNRPHYWDRLDLLISSHKVVIDRPKGSFHPRYPILTYPIDYGYLEGTTGGDGNELDVWRGSDTGLKLVGVVCTVDSKKGDAETKLLVGCTESEIRTVEAFHNNPYMSAIVIRRF